MRLEEYLKNYNLEIIFKIEESKDFQYLALKNLRENISSKKKINKNINIENLFLYLIIKNSIISYQLSWTWENWRNEFSDFAKLNFFKMDNSNNIIWYNFLKNSKNNKRLIDLKIKRLNKLDQNFKENFIKLDKLKTSDFIKILDLLCKSMNQSTTDKTMSFAIKMLGYWYRIVYKKKLFYPYEICIPLDSRISKIYCYEKKIESTKLLKKEIIDYFFLISKKYFIPCLHLDSLLWIDYWNNHYKNK